MNDETEQIFLLNTGQGPSVTLAEKMVGGQLPGTAHTSLENVDDFSNVCRTCATVTEFVIPIFAGEGLQNNLAEKIHKHLPIKVSETDVLPRVVCYQCASTLLAWHELVQCCVQADAALQARVQESKCAVTKPNPTLTEDAENKLALVPVTRAVSRARSCPFCGVTPPHAEFRKHVVVEHSHLLFHCEECSGYVDRKNFLVHMAQHAALYAAPHAKQELLALEAPRRRKHKKLKEENDVKQSQNTSGLAPLAKIERETPVQELDNSEKKQTNEFSDHSDTEDGFGPLPESVFEAIEDTQDSQPAEDEGASRAEHSSTAAGDDAGELAEDGRDASTKAGKDKKDQKVRTCPICGKQYRASSSYFYHMKYVHARSREHACEQCGRRFGTRAALAQHAPLHTGESRYECTLCHKRFRTNASLYIHAQTHGADKAWSCGTCGRAFRWRAALARHAARHAGARAHACPRCPRAFSVRADLLRHARTHARGDHTCDKCGHSFAQLRYLKVHLKKKH